MKKIIALILSICLLLTLFSSCTQKDERSSKSGLKIVTSIFPEYDWVMNILGERADETELTLLLDSGVDLHSYQPTATDIMKISSADIFIYIGGESDKWVKDAVSAAKNENLNEIALMELIADSLKDEEISEGMQADDEEDETYDEHVWLSLKNTAKTISLIANAIENADPEHAAEYEENANAYIEKINQLDKEYEAAVENANKDTLLFADRFPFRYLTEDYKLKYYAAFPGCSAETEASFETVKFLAQKTDELSLNYLITIEGSNSKIADTIIQNTKDKDQKTLIMDSMQSVTREGIDEGKTYLSIMEKNLDVLKEALS